MTEKKNETTPPSEALARELIGLREGVDGVRRALSDVEAMVESLRQEVRYPHPRPRYRAKLFDDDERRARHSLHV